MQKGNSAECIKSDEACHHRRERPGYFVVISQSFTRQIMLDMPNYKKLKLFVKIYCDNIHKNIGYLGDYG